MVPESKSVNAVVGKGVGDSLRRTYMICLVPGCDTRNYDYHTICGNPFTCRAFGETLDAKAVKYGLSGVILVITYKK